MSLLGIDVGTTGCKAAVFSEKGRLLASAYEEYDIQRPRPGWAELDAANVWERVKRTIGRAAASAPSDPIGALAVSSLGEAMVPVTADRRVLGPSILLIDARGNEYVEGLGEVLDDERVYQINGNTLGRYYSLPKLLWIRDHQPGLYDGTHKFLLWGSFVSYMLGAEPAVDYSLANRTLLFDLDRGDWSDELLDLTGLDRARLPDTVPSGTVVGRVSPQVAAEVGLPAGVPIAAGAHDQCANAVGCGVLHEGQAMCGLGTFPTIAAVFARRRDTAQMIARGLNTEHHAAPGRYVSLLFNQGGAVVKWYRDTFAAEEHRRAESAGRDVYDDLFAELPEAPGSVVALPNFAGETRGAIAGLRLDTSRGDVLKGIIEGITFDLRAQLESLPPVGIEIDEYRAAGGGSRSDGWAQICADILGRPFIRPRITEAGSLGAAVIAGVGAGTFPSFEAGVEAMVALERTFEPDPGRQGLYEARFERYTRLQALLEAYLRDPAAP